jgi:peptide/nickel transport system permease protein
MSTAVAAIAGDAAAAQAPGFARRLVCRPLAVACIVFLLVVIGVAIVAPELLPGVRNESVGDLLRVRRGPSAQNLLGTDNAGRDVLNRLLYGTRLTMIGVVEVVLVGTLLGVPIGLAAGYLGGWVDRAVAWWTDLMFAVPGLIIILVVVAIFPKNLLAAMVTFGVLSARGLARTVRAVTLPLREELYMPLRASPA